jgi:multicomponent Na+:H+ antiporter subunit D
MPSTEVDPESAYRRDRVPLTMTIPTIALLAGGLAVGLVPGLAADAVGAATRFIDQSAYVATVLDGAPSPDVAGTFAGPHAKDWLFALLGLSGAIALAAVALLRGPVLDALGEGAAGRSARAGLAGMRALHSGHVGDYVTWLVVGTVALGAVWAATLG